MSRFSKQSARRLRIEQLEDRALLSSYTFTKIADTGDQFTDFSRAPALNNSGAVAFLARPNAGRGNACLYTGDGGALTTIACEDALNANLGMFPSINDNGSVAIVLSHGMDQRVVTGAGGPLTTLYASQEYGFYSFSAPSLNRSGVVAFWVSTAILSRPEEVAAGDGGVPAIIDHSESFGFTHFGSFPALNNGGIVAYHYLFRTPDLSVDAIKTGDSETTATLYSNQEGFFSSFGDPAFNDKGSAAYFAVLARGGSGIFAGNGGPVNIIATTGKNFKSFATAPAESNRDGVAFSAELTAGGSGIFTGPDPVMDKVVATGDEVSGAQVTELHFFREGLNDNGQLAFFAALADGTSGVYRADPDGGAPGSRGMRQGQLSL